MVNPINLNAQLVIIQHNVLAWTDSRRIELANLYLNVNPHIILLNSHGRTDDDQIKIYPYKFYQQNYRQTGNDGVAIGVRLNIPHRVIRDFNSETVAITFTTTEGDFTVATCYLPPSRPYVPDRDFNRLMNIRHPVYLLGDVNAHHQAFGYNNINAVGVQLVASINRGEWSHLGPDFTTYYNHNGKGRPDIVLRNRNSFHNYYVEPGPPSSSDHLPVIIRISTNPIANRCTPRFDYNNADWESFKTELEHSITLDDMDGRLTTTIDTVLENWYDKILTAKTNSIPMKVFKIVPHPHNSDLQRNITEEIGTLLADAEVVGWSRAHYARLKTLQRRLLEEAKRLYIQKWAELMSDVADSIKYPWQFWRKISRLMGTNYNSPVDYLLTPTGEKIFDMRGKEEVMREAWKRVFELTDAENRAFDAAFEREVEEHLNHRAHEITPHVTIDLTRLTEDDPLAAPITQEDVVNTIKRFKKRKAPGKTGIRREDLANLPHKATQQLANILSASLSAGYFPTKFKQAKMVFIPKEGKDSRQPMGNRPISLLETPGKVFERILADRLRDYTEDNEIQDPCQYGYRERRGTTRALAITWEQIATAVAKKGNATLVLRDLEKAFDRVWHRGLKFRLLEIRTPDLLCRTVCNFLDGRSACIRIGSYIGPPFPLTTGVPQGSVLSPTLFITYTSDTPPPTQEENHTAFADDHSQLTTYPSKRRAIIASRTIRALKRRKTYEKKKKITNNEGKMRIITARRRKPSRFVVDGVRLQTQQSGKLLGCRLKWSGAKSQVTHNARKARLQLSKLRRFHALPAPTKRHLYVALVRSVLEYPPVPLHTSSKGAMYELQVVQNLALRWIHGREEPGRRTSNEQLHRIYKLQPMNVRLHKLARRVWERAIEDEDVNIRRIEHQELYLEPNEEHRYWPRSKPRALGPPPRPLYVR